MAGSSAADDSSLKRLGSGRWQTRDERFTIEPQSGTWVVVDAEQTDDLGLPLVRGPFRSLTAAKEAIGDARTSPPAASPLADRIGRGRAAGAEAPAGTAKARAHGSKRTDPTPAAKASSRPSSRRDEASSEPAEPRWLADLEPDARRNARRMIARLGSAGASDPEGMARRDIVGGVPAVAAHAIERRLDGLDRDAKPAAVAALLSDGRDDDLGVRWRLVDGEGRPITIAQRRGK